MLSWKLSTTWQQIVLLGLFNLFSLANSSNFAKKIESHHLYTDEFSRSLTDEIVVAATYAPTIKVDYTAAYLILLWFGTGIIVVGLILQVSSYVCIVENRVHASFIALSMMMLGVLLWAVGIGIDPYAGEGWLAAPIISALLLLPFWYFALREESRLMGWKGIAYGILEVPDEVPQQPEAEATEQSALLETFSDNGANTFCLV